MKKKIGLLIPHHFSLYECIVKNIEANNYDVELLLLTDTHFKYKNFTERLINLFQKVILRNKNFKATLRVKRHSELLDAALKNFEINLDYCLVIRPDYFTKDSLRRLKQKSDVFAAYQWDGFKRYPKITEYISLFDRFFVFEKDDYFKYKDTYDNIYPTTNFYIDYFKKDSSSSKNEIFFLGSYLENRIDDIIQISSFLKRNNIESNIQIVYTKSNIPEKLENSGIKILRSALTYSEMIAQIATAKYLLEFQNNNIHNGLSFRVFEALYFKKKLITNNKEIKKYDFYHPHNIFVWESDNLHELQSFLNQDYVEIDPRIYEKYSFSNWIQYVFGQPPYQPITY